MERSGSVVQLRCAGRSARRRFRARRLTRWGYWGYWGCQLRSARRSADERSRDLLNVDRTAAMSGDVLTCGSRWAQIGPKCSSRCEGCTCWPCPTSQAAKPVQQVPADLGGPSLGEPLGERWSRCRCLALAPRSYRRRGSPAGTASATSPHSSDSAAGASPCRLNWADGRKPAYMFAGQPHCAAALRPPG